MALDHIDEVISIIRSSQTDSEASSRLIERFGFTPEQTTAILEMKLRRLTGLERDKIQEELDGLRRAIAYYEDLLAHEEKILGVIKEEMREISKSLATNAAPRSAMSRRTWMSRTSLPTRTWL